jgi:hypothetical protein
MSSARGVSRPRAAVKTPAVPQATASARTGITPERGQPAVKNGNRGAAVAATVAAPTSALGRPIKERADRALVTWVSPAIDFPCL